jgi:hypothetical protein
LIYSSTTGAFNPQELWQQEASNHKYDTKRCNIDRIAINSSTEENFKVYFKSNRPVILQQPLRGPAEERVLKLQLKESLSRDRMISLWGSESVNVGTPYSLAAFGGDVDVTTTKAQKEARGVFERTLEEYITNLRDSETCTSSGFKDKNLYLFDKSLRINSRITYNPFPFPFTNEPELRIAVGTTGSGINFHFHKVCVAD